MENPQLFLDGGSGLFHPVVVPGEVFLLKRVGMHFSSTFEDEVGERRSVAADGCVALSPLPFLSASLSLGSRLPAPSITLTPSFVLTG